MIPFQFVTDFYQSEAREIFSTPLFGIPAVGIVFA